MASSSKPPSEPSETSYTMYDRDSVNDAALVGKHCEHPYCNQLDFLPFLCQSCTKTFCLDHRTETAHNCARAGAWAQRRRQAELAKHSIGEGRPLRDAVPEEKPCASPSCKSIIGTSLKPGVHCTTCRRDYCLKHRLPSDHDCKNLEPLGSRLLSAKTQAEVASRARGALEKLRAWGAAKKEAAGRSLPKARPSTASQRIVAVNTLKKSARGDDKLAPEKRVYLYVEAEAETAKAKFPKGQFFYSRDWVVGRLLDAAAKSLQVQNVNNTSAEEKDKLRVFHVEGGRVLEYKDKVGDVLVSGNTVVLLRGVGAPPDLIEM